jgi:hypothetical protein
VRHIGESLVRAMEMALDAGKKEAAELVAAECVVEAETKDHLNWELISQVAKSLKGPEGKALKEAHEQVEEPGRRASLSHHGLVPGALDPVTGAAGGSPTARRREGREDRDRRGPGQERTQGDALAGSCLTAGRGNRITPGPRRPLNRVQTSSMSGGSGCEPFSS